MLPTQRVADKYGSGAYGAPRGSRTHNGVDLGAYPGLPIISVCDGTLTKIGYPYSQDDSRKEGMSEKGAEKFDKKKALRYVQITNEDGLDFRYFYVGPVSVLPVWSPVKVGMVIGYAQGLQDIYPGITDHIHFEVKKDAEYLDPRPFLAG